MAQIAIIFTGILGLLVKRRLSLSRTEFKVSDFEEGGLIPKEEAAEAVQEVVQSVPEVSDGPTDKSRRRYK